MGMRKAVICTVLLILLAGPIAAQDDEQLFPRDLEDLRVGDETQMTATLSNPLPVEDEIKLSMTGDALMQGLITVDIDSSDPEVYNCNPAQTRCSVGVEAEGTKDVTLDVEATAIGQGTLKGVANSSTTGLSSENELSVLVDTGFINTNVSAPGITLVHLLLIGLLGGVAVFAVRQHTPDQS